MQSNFRPPSHLRQAAKFMLQHPTLWTGNNRNIEAKNCFYMNFCTRGRLMSERLWQTALADHCTYKRQEIFAGHTGDWFDVKTSFDMYHSVTSGTLWNVSFWTVWNLRWLASYLLMVSLETSKSHHQRSYLSPQKIEEQNPDFIANSETPFLCCIQLWSVLPITSRLGTTVTASGAEHDSRSTSSCRWGRAKSLTIHCIFYG